MQPDPDSVDEISNIVSEDTEYETQIEKLEKLRNDFSSRGEYDKAKLCGIKEVDIKKLAKEKKKKDLEEQQNAEMEDLIQKYQKDVENLNAIWDKKFENLKDKSEKAEISINERQQKEMNELYSALEQKTPSKIKFSKEYLSLENEEKMLVKFHKFDEAKIIRKRKEIQKQKDIDKWNKEREEKIKGQLIQKSNKHATEKNVLKKKFEVELDILRAEKQKEIQHLEKKFQNKKLELELQQKSEMNLAENELINKKKQFGLSYCVVGDKNDSHHFRAYTNSTAKKNQRNYAPEDEEREFQVDEIENFYNGQESESEFKKSFNKTEFETQENEKAKNKGEIDLSKDDEIPINGNVKEKNKKEENKEEEEEINIVIKTVKK